MGLESTIEAQTDNYQSLIPPENDPELGQALFRILADIIAEKNRLGLADKWNRHYELGKNKHWRLNPKNVSLLTANLLHAHRQRTVNLLTDNNPTFDVTRIGMSDSLQYDILVKACEYWWNETEQQSVLERSIIQGETYGCTIEKVSYYPGEIAYNPETKQYVLLNIGGEEGGEVEVSVIDPFYFGIYPSDVEDIQKATVVVHYRPMPLWEAILRWPEKKEEIKPDEEWIKEISDSRKELVYGKDQSGSYMAKIMGVVRALVGKDIAPTRDHKTCLIAEFWVKDYTIDKETGEAKYPGCIRCITVCNGGHLVLDDRPNPSINPLLPKELARKTYLWDKFPFSLTPSLTDPNCIWGMSDFEQLETLQVEINKTISQWTYYKDKASRLKIINPKTSGVDSTEFSNTASVIEPSNEMAANAIRYMSGPEPPQDLPAILSVYKDLFAIVAGQFELEQAQGPGRDVIAYKAIAALIERAATMLRGKIRNYSRMIRQRGRMYVALAQNWYTEERLIPIEYEGEIYTEKITGKDLILPGRITVVTGSTMPVSRVQEREEAIEIFNRGGCDVEELLKKLNWSNRKEILRRMALGPLNDLKTKMETAGVAPEILDWINQVEQMKPKELQRAVQQGEFPSFNAVLAQILSSSPQRSPQEGAMEMESQSKALLAQAEAEYRRAQTMLIQEQITTEKVKQYTMLGGIKFDEEKLKTDRAKVVHEIETSLGTGSDEPLLRTRQAKGQGVAGIKTDNRIRTR